MVTVHIVCIGKLKEKYWREAIEEYAKRLSSYCRFVIQELPEERLPENPSEAQIQQCLEKEGDAILSALKGKKFFSLCIEGRSLSSEQLAVKMENDMSQGESHLCFVIGGSYGLSPKVKKAAAFSLSFSPMTFPHQMMRVILCEQIYRAFTIMQGGKYHK